MPSRPGKPHRGDTESDEEYQRRIVEWQNKLVEWQSLTKDQQDSALVPVGLDQIKTLLDLVMDGDDLGLTPEQKIKFDRIRQLNVTLQPGRLRLCERPGTSGKSSCPMHDDCPFIKNIPLASRPYDKRCHFEADLMQQAYQESVEYIKSMDPENNEIPAVELGLCKDLAYQTVVEHRLSLYIAIDPAATQVAAIPGAGGATKKEENPGYQAWVRSVEKRNKYQKDLHAMVQNRLKRVEKKAEARIKTIDAFKRVMGEKTDLPQTAAGSVFLEADFAVKKNVEEEKKRDADRGNQPKSTE